MSHSVYISDPDGHGIEVLYDLPSEVWEGDIDGALNYFKPLAKDGPEALEDSTEYATFG
jgi:catechol 2,3-dioxygenase